LSDVVFVPFGGRSLKSRHKAALIDELAAFGTRP
jgi:hypothetical protein